MSLNHYFEALERLKNNVPINVPIGSKINKDTVCLEAGRKRGSIKKSRSSHARIIAEIHATERQRLDPILVARNATLKQKNRVKDYKSKYHEALNREVMYLNKIANLLKTE